MLKKTYEMKIGPKAFSENERDKKLTVEILVYGKQEGGRISESNDSYKLVKNFSAETVPAGFQLL